MKNKSNFPRIVIGFISVSLVILFFAVLQGALLPRLNVRSSPSDTGKKTFLKIKRPKDSQNRTYREWVEKGEQALGRGDAQAALAAFQNAAVASPGEILPYEKIGDIAFSQKDYETALKNYEFAGAAFPQNSALKIKIGRTLLGKRKVLDAKIKFESMELSQASAYYEGLIAAFLNDGKGAKSLLTKSLTLGPDENYRNAAQKILTVYRDVELERDGKLSHLQAKLALAFSQIGEYGLAIELGFAALKTDHNYRDVWITLGYAYLQENKLFDAEDAFTKAIELDAGQPASYFYRGMARQKISKLPEAIKDFEQAIGLGWQPKIFANLALGDLYFDQKDFRKAFSFYKEVVMADSSDINRFTRPVALAINHLNLSEEALALARKAYEAHPDTAKAHNLLGWAFLANNDPAASRLHLEKALELDPRFDAAHLNLGQLEEREGNLIGAKRQYEMAVSLAQQNSNVSIEETASLRYNAIQNRPLNALPLPPPSSPDPRSLIPHPSFIPSLSLE